MVVKHLQSFSIVDDCGFKKFVGLLKPTDVLLTRKAPKNMVLKIYEKERTKGKA